MIKLLKGNCLDLLRTLESDCADLVLIDPPYSSGGLFAGDRKQDTRVKYTDSDYNGAARFPSFSGDNMDQHSFIQFMTHVSMELREKTKDGGAIQTIFIPIQTCNILWEYVLLPAIPRPLQNILPHQPELPKRIFYNHLTKR